VTSRGARRQEQRELARSLRAQGRPWAEIATTLRDRYGLTARVAMRVAHDWSQADAAGAWNSRWPDDPKSFKNISYWETWPSPTGHAPSLSVLERLAQVYECSVADLVAGWGEHGPTADAPTAEPEALAWQVEHLGLPELTRSLADRAERLPAPQRRAMMLKLSTAAAVAAGRSAGRPAPALGNGPNLAELAGDWTSRYTYFSTGRDTELEGVHSIQLRAETGRLVGRSEQTETGCIELDLRADGLLVTGSWTERTAAGGYYRGAVYHGVVQLVVDPVGRSMAGQWLGPDKHFAINSGRWTLTRA
jgi:hypothetical protein